MKIVGAGSRDDIHDGTRVAAIFSAELRLQVEFLNPVERQKRCRGTRNAHLVERGIVEERIVVVRAVQRVVVRTVAIPVDIELAEAFFGTGNAGAFDGDAWCKRDEFAEVAPVQRELLDEPAIDHLGKCRAGGFHQWDIFRNDDLFQFLRRLGEFEIDDGRLTDIHNDMRSAYFLETRRNRGNFVLTGRQLQKKVNAFGIRSHFARLAGAQIAFWRRESRGNGRQSLRRGSNRGRTVRLSPGRQSRWQS